MRKSQSLRRPTIVSSDLRRRARPGEAPFFTTNLTSIVCQSRWEGPGREPTPSSLILNARGRCSKGYGSDRRKKRGPRRITPWALLRLDGFQIGPARWSKSAWLRYQSPPDGSLPPGMSGLEIAGIERPLVTLWKTGVNLSITLRSGPTDAWAVMSTLSPMPEGTLVW